MKLIPQSDLMTNVIGNIGCILTLGVAAGTLIPDSQKKMQENQEAMQIVKEHDINKYIYLLETGCAGVEDWKKEANIIKDSLSKTTSTIQTNYAKTYFLDI